MEAGEPADQMALDRHRPVAVDAAQDRARALTQAAQKRARAPVDKALHQGLVQRVGEPVLEAPRPALPCLRIGEPVRAIGDIGEGPHPGEAGRQRVDVAVGPVEARELALHPVFRHPPVALGEVLEHRSDEARVLVLRRLAKVRDLADLPQPHQIRSVARAPKDHFVGRELAQRGFILGFRREPQSRRGRRCGERAHQRLNRLEIEPGIAPFRGHDGWEDMAFDRRHDVRVEIRRIGRYAERAVLAKSAGAPGDLGDLLRIEPAPTSSVELVQAGEGDMVDIHVQPHPDRVGRDQEVDFAGLEQIDLGVAGARTERAHDDGRPAALAADELGDGVNRVGGESDDGAARRQAGQLLRAGVAELGQSLAEPDLGVRTEPANQRGDCRCAHQHRLGRPSRMQEPMGEQVAALRIGAKLDLVDREKFDLAVERHRLDRADEIARPERNDLFFAGDQRDLGRAPRLDHPIVNFARQQPQRQADHARGMSQHALDRQMRLARIRRAQNGDEPRGVAPRWRAIHERQCGTCRRAPQASALV